MDPVSPGEVICGNRILEMCHHAGVAYAKTDYISTLVPGAPGRIVTHNGGWNIRRGPHGWFAVTSPNCSVSFAEIPEGWHWWCLNAEADDPRLHGVPLGVDNWEVPECGRGSKHYTLPPDGSLAGMLILDRIGKRLPLVNRVYLRLRLDTAPYERTYCQKALENAPFVTSVDDRVDTDTFFDALASHEFVLCPEGNGIDCHRIWEALYLGCWPIVKRTRAMLEFKGLPILWVDSWDDVQEWLLDAHLEKVKDGQFSMDKATLSYWRRAICQA